MTEPSVQLTQQLAERVAERLGLPRAGLVAAAMLFAEGATVPFVARYRKDRTGGLDDEQLRRAERALEEERAFEARRAVIRASLEKGGHLTAAAEKSLAALRTKAELEDFYMPYKAARRTKAAVAKERGLEPLAASLLEPGERRTPEQLAQAFVDPSREVGSVVIALSGAQDILVDGFALDPEARRRIRSGRLEHGLISAQASRGKKAELEASPYRELAGLKTRVAQIKPHRVLALDRAEREELLSVHVEGDAEREFADLARMLLPRPRTRPLDELVREALGRALSERIGPACERDVRRILTEEAHEHSIAGFCLNLRQLLRSPPLGRKVILALDPGFRSGCKCAVVDGHGAVLKTDTVYPFSGEGSAREAAEDLETLITAFRVELVAIGNGTGSRETGRFIKNLLKQLPGEGRPAQAIVSEVGASVYSASEIAREEHPDLDVTLRGALSIGRRLQDPLAELDKIEPKSLGVGQYQHDLEGKRLDAALDGVVEQVVSEVGVDLNRASASLLKRVPGIGPKLATRILERRAKQPFAARSELRELSGFGPRTYEQAAGFLRVPESAEPLDRSSVHPESYGVARRIAAHLDRAIERLVGDPEGLLAALDPAAFVEGETGIEAVRDILRELAAPGRDPRGTAPSFEYTEGIESFDDLKEGMRLRGTVTNMSDFGAFVDLGVHRDGLIHVSQFGRRVAHPSEAVTLGENIEVRVEAVDRERKRVSLSLVAAPAKDAR